MMAEKLKVLLLNQELGGKMGARGRVKYENNFFAFQRNEI